MVRLTAQLIARGTAGYIKKKKDESPRHFVKRLTHLYLEDKNITEVGEDLALCRNLVVLYLYDNLLTEVPCLNFNCNLTHLYLQNNNISKITNLSTLPKLVKLYLGGNHITVVEGLENLHQLQELHVENQRLPKGEQLLFDPRSLLCLSGHLEVLNISGNKLESLKDLEILSNLTHLSAADNQLNDLQELLQLFASWPDLRRLELSGNPLCHRTKYKDRIIVKCRQLGMLDGKEINDTAREFLRKWYATRESNKRKHEEFIRRASFITESIQRDKVSEHTYQELPPVHPQPRHGSAFHNYLMPGVHRKPFKTLPSHSGAGDSVSQQFIGIPQNNAPTAYTDCQKTASSAPVHRRPFLSVSVELLGNINQNSNVAPF